MATHADADLILRFYDLRREAVMREARAWFLRWMPASGAEAKAVGSDLSRQDNAWLRQVTSFWEMAFSIANAGAIDKDLFAKNCGEGMLCLAKCQLLKERFPEDFQRGMPEAEAFAAGSPIAAQKLAMFRKRFGG